MELDDSRRDNIKAQSCTGQQDELESAMQPEEAILNFEIAGTVPDTVKASDFELLMLNVGQLGVSFFWFGLQIQIIPSQVRSVAGDARKTSVLGLIVSLGAVVTVVWSPLVGRWSDQTQMRTPFLVGGIVTTFISIELLAAASPNIPSQSVLAEPLPSWGIYGYSACYLALQAAFLLLSVPYQALLAERTPHDQRGKSSGMNAGLTSLGSLLAAAFGMTYHSINNVFVSVTTGSLVLTLSMILVLRYSPKYHHLHDQRSNEHREIQTRTSSACCVLGAYMEPFKNLDFFWVFVTRFLMQQGLATISWFLEYFLQEMVDLSGMRSETAVSLAFLPMLIAAGPAAVLGGYMSDRRGASRKLPVISASVLMSICAIVVALWVRKLYQAIIVNFFFGVGYGMFLAVDFALVMDVLPSKRDVSRDMAIWHNALILPNLIATPIGGLIRDSIGGTTGYMVLFAITCFYFLLSAVLVTRIKRAN